MNCQDFQRELLNSENPAAPAEEFEAHLATCGACREYQGALVQIEENVAKLPVPASGAKEEFIQTLLQPESAAPAVGVMSIPERPPLPLSTKILLIVVGLVLLGSLIAAGVLLGQWLATVVK